MNFYAMNYYSTNYYSRYYYSIRRVIQMIVFIGLAVSSVFANAQVANADAIEITQVRMPPVPPVSRTAAIYLSIKNNSDKAITLVGIHTPVAHHSMIHLTQETSGVAKMHHLEKLVIAANSQLEFLPGGHHIMLMGLERELLSKPFIVTLEFAEQVSRTFKVIEQE